MVECPQGHQNPDGWQLCGECGSPIESSPDDSWYRARWAIAGVGVLAVIVFAVAAIAFISSDNQQTGPSAPASTDQGTVLEWWSQAREHVTDLQQSLADAQRALATVDRSAMDEACRKMHDSAAVDLRAHLPAPTQN